MFNKTDIEYMKPFVNEFRNPRIGSRNYYVIVG